MVISHMQHFFPLLRIEFFGHICLAGGVSLLIDEEEVEESFLQSAVSDYLVPKTQVPAMLWQWKRMLKYYWLRGSAVSEIIGFSS